MPDVIKRLNEMRCAVCGHRLDDMADCDSCAADREAEFVEHEDHEEFVEDCGLCHNDAEANSEMWSRMLA